MDLNKTCLIGNLVREPETKTLPSGQSVTKVSVATNFRWKDKKTGELKTKANFHNIVAWNKLGDIMSQYLKKGDRIYIEGRIDNRSWEDKEGNKKYFTDIVAQEMIMLGGSGKKEDIEKRSQEVEIVEEENSGESPF